MTFTREVSPANLNGPTGPTLEDLGSIDHLIRLATHAAMVAASDYIAKHRREAGAGDNIKIEVDPDTLASRIADHVKSRWDEAIRDAREALDAGMADLAGPTFFASMRLAGIEAAKEVVDFARDMQTHVW